MVDLKSFWKWLGDPNNRAILAFIGAGLSVLVGGIWALYIHFTPKQASPDITQGPESEIIEPSKVIFKTAVREYVHLSAYATNIPEEQKVKEVRDNTVDRTVFRKRVFFSAEKEPPGSAEDDLSAADSINELRVMLLLGDNRNNPFFFNIANFVKSGESKKLTEPPVIATTAIKPNKKTVVLSQKRLRGHDLAGNFTADFTIRLQNRRHSGFIILGPFEKDGNPLEPKDVKIGFGSLVYPVTSEPINCDLESEYAIKHVEVHNSIFFKSHPQVISIRGNSKVNEVQLISKEELRTLIYQIVLAGQDHPLYLGRPSRELDSGINIIDKNPLRFMKFDDAKRFLAWLKESKSTKVGKYKIYRDEHNALDKKEIDKLRIMAKQLN